jgi:hypothetical protein
LQTGLNTIKGRNKMFEANWANPDEFREAIILGTISQKITSETVMEVILLKNIVVIEKLETSNV